MKKRCPSCSVEFGWSDVCCSRCSTATSFVELVVDEATCNMCGMTCFLGVNAMVGGNLANHGLIDQYVTGGYSSTPGNGEGALDDMTSYRFSLCEFCLDWLFSRFKLPPHVEDVGSGHVETWQPALDRVMHDDWRKMKQKFIDEFTKRNAARNG